MCFPAPDMGGGADDLHRQAEEDGCAGAEAVDDRSAPRLQAPSDQ